MKVRFVGRQYNWAEHRDDLISFGATQSASLVTDFLALKMGLDTFEADAVDAYFQAPEHEEVVVEPARSTWNDLPKLEGTHTHRVSFETAVARRAAGQSWVEHVAGILVNKLGCVRCTTAPQFLLEF